MTLLPASRVMLALASEEAKMFEFLSLSRQLVSGYLAACPDNEKNVMKQAYFDSKRSAEHEWNKKHSEKLEKIQHEFDRFKAKALQSDDPALYRDMKFRVIHDAEDECLHEELGENAHGIFLKIDSATFTPDRFLQVFLNENAPDFEERKKQEKLIHEANDQAYLEENRLSGGNTTLGRFSGQLLGHVKMLVATILKNKPIVAGELCKSKALLEKMPCTERQLLLMNVFSDLFFQLETMCGSGLFRRMAEIKNDNELLGCRSVDDGVLGQLDSAKERIFKVVESKEKYACESLNMDEINDYAPRFFENCKTMCGVLSDFHALLQVKVKMDFSKQALPVRSRTSSMSNSHSPQSSLSLSSSLSSSGSLSPRSIDSQKLSPRVNLVPGVAAFSQRSHSNAQMQEPIVHDAKHVQKYVTAFATILEIFQKFVHAEKAKSHLNIFGF